MNVGAANGEVLKSNASGVGTWQADRFVMPVTDTHSGLGVGLTLTQTGTSDLAVFNISNPDSNAESVQGSSNGGGDVFSSTMTGTGRAGYFVISNGSNTQAALTGSTNGSSGTTNRGVYGVATSTTGVTTGVRGEAFSQQGTGVWGKGESTEGTGVLGQGALGVYGLSSIIGVYGYSTGAGGTGVRGETASVNAIAVLGQEIGTNPDYGVYAGGDLGASGSKSFRIDHPLDPENKYLLHYSSESPFPQNFYSGNVVTDARGKGWVTLPDYFHDINANFKYQLTVVDNTESNQFVQVKVAREIVDGKFLVMTSAPNVKVSWRVEADRNDLRMRFKKPVEVKEKPSWERGKYQHPEMYGKPESMGTFYRGERTVPRG